MSELIFLQDEYSLGEQRPDIILSVISRALLFGTVPSLYLLLFSLDRQCSQHTAGYEQQRDPKCEMVVVAGRR